MATKPTSTYTFATDATFGSGPASGLSTKNPALDEQQGFVPGQSIAADAVNYYLNFLGAWTGWLAEGSFNGGVDAHIVETDSTGTSRVAAMQAGGAVGLYDWAFRAVPAMANADGYSAELPNGSTASAYRAVIKGTGHGAFLTQDQGDAILLELLKTAASGATNPVGRLAAQNTATGLELLPQGGGAGLEVKGGPATPQRGAAHLAPTRNPIAPLVGDIWLNDGLQGHPGPPLSYYNGDGQRRTTWATLAGHGRQAATDSVALAAAGPQDVVAFDLDTGGSEPPGEYDVTAVVRVNVNGAPPVGITLSLQLVYDGTPIQTIQIPADDAAFASTFGDTRTLGATVVLPNAATNELKVTASLGGAPPGTVDVECYLRATGAY